MPVSPPLVGKLAMTQPEVRGTRSPRVGPHSQGLAPGQGHLDQLSGC